MLMKNFNIQNYINKDLKPDNASQKGYKLIEDVINPYELLKEVFEIAAEKGFKFGKSSEHEKGKLGLYVRINKTKQ